MALLLAPVASLFSRAYEWTIGYDEKVQAYLEAKSRSEAEKNQAWQAIMDHIALYPKTHSTLVTTKFVGDTVCLFAAAKASWPFIKSCGKDVAQAFRRCFDGFVNFMRNAYNAVYDIYNASQSASQKFMEIMDRIFKSLVDKWNRFIKILNDAYSKVHEQIRKAWDRFNVNVGPGGRLTITIAGSTVTFIPLDVAQRVGITIRQGLGLIFSSVGLLLMWIGGQMAVEGYKYFCSMYGLIQYWISLIPVK